MGPADQYNNIVGQATNQDPSSGFMPSLSDDSAFTGQQWYGQPPVPGASMGTFDDMTQLWLWQLNAGDYPDGFS